MSRGTTEEIFVVPHFHNKGGAGQYIMTLINELKAKYKIQIIGPYANFYTDTYSKDNSSNSSIEIPKRFFGLVIPNYLGVRFVIKAFYFLRLLGLLITSFFWKPSNYKRIFILTSSIQIPLLGLLKWKFKDSRFVLFIQENYLVGSFVGALLNKILNKSDILVSISESWNKHAQEAGLKPLLLRNQFNDQSSKNETNDIQFDILFLGGNQNIKGANEFLKILKLASNKKVKLDAAWLGTIDDKFRESIRHIERSNFVSVTEFGFVNDVSNYINVSRMVIFPIKKAHFLRPAIEAGLCYKSFIIRDLKGIEDFALAGFNCLVFKTNEEALSSIIKLKSEDSFRGQLEENNHSLANRFLELANSDMKVFLTEFDKLVKNNGALI